MYFKFPVCYGVESGLGLCTIIKGQKISLAQSRQEHASHKLKNNQELAKQEQLKETSYHSNRYRQYVMAYYKFIVLLQLSLLFSFFLKLLCLTVTNGSEGLQSLKRLLEARGQECLAWSNSTSLHGSLPAFQSDWCDGIKTWVVCEGQRVGVPGHYFLYFQLLLEKEPSNDMVQGTPSDSWVVLIGPAIKLVRAEHKFCLNAAKLPS